MMGDQGEMLPLFGRHVRRPGEIAHIDQIGFQQLPQPLVGLSGHDGRRQRPDLHFRETMRQEAQLPHHHIHLAECRLSFIQGDEGYFGLNRHTFGQSGAAMGQHIALRTLDIHFEEIHLGDFGDVVEAMRWRRGGGFHFSPCRKQIEKRQMRRIGNQQAGHPVQAADMRGARGSIAQGIGQVTLARAGHGLEPDQGFGQRLEPNDIAQTSRQHPLIRRIAIDGVGAHIHDGRGPCGSRI